MCEYFVLFFWMGFYFVGVFVFFCEGYDDFVGCEEDVEVCVVGDEYLGYEGVVGGCYYVGFFV